MKQREFKFRRLDIAAFVEDAGLLQGEIALPDLPRLHADLYHQADPARSQPVRWQARGEARARRGARPELWLHLQAETEVPLECQRCLQPVFEPLRIDRWFRFVENETLAAELDEDSDDDVLVQSSAFDLQELIEDELLLELPVVPHHEVCPTPLQYDSSLLVPDGAPEASADEPAPVKPHPFAALAALKKTGSPDDDSGAS